jgi:Uma2 family endonuclease
MTLAQFLAWEERQEPLYEFDGFQPVAMTGRTIAHDQITFDLRKALDARLAGKPCRPHGPNVKVIVDGRVRYPDAFIVCSPVSQRATVADNPVVVFEVLSEGNPGKDLIEKNHEYRATPSIQRYVILEQTSAAAMAFVRRGEDWLTEIIRGNDAAIRLPEAGIEVPLAEVYANIEFDQADEPPA